MSTAKESSKKVFKKVLPNGMTILVRPTHIVPKVSVQLWYGVGSKDEKSEERGIAHLIEHMIFKGTNKLSESDINNITHKLSGYCNAFTSYDYTGYLFNFPTHHWDAALPIMSDCMRNCTFKEELLSSEMKAVIQELKMYRDNYSSTLIETMISNIFPDHPYHFPIIGFKQDLWSLKREHLVAFYRKHYVPNNATLVVVGDVTPEEVFEKAQKEFGAIEADPEYKRDSYYLTKDLLGTTTTLHRDVKQPMAFISYLVPGARDNKDYALNVLSLLIGQGKASRLYQKLVEEMHLATELEAFSYDLFDQGLFFIYFQPKNTGAIDQCIDIINKEIEAIQQEGFTEQELLRATKKTESQYYSLLEDAEKQAYFIGQSYLATGNEQMLFNYLEEDQEQLTQDIQNIIKMFRPAIMHTGKILPLEEKDQPLWKMMQARSDEEDNKILSRVVRTAPVEQEVEAAKIQPKEPGVFDFPQPKKVILSNGLTLLYLHNPNVEKIEIMLDLEAKHFYDPIDQQGLSNFVSSMLQEGTKKHSATELAQEIETYGMSLSTAPGHVQMSMLSADFERGLNLLTEVLTESTFPQSTLEKIRTQLLADLDNYWDTPTSFADQLARSIIYRGHPYEKNSLGTRQTLTKFTQKDLINFYHKTVTPKKAVIAIVGDLLKYDIEKLVNKTLGTWQGEQPPELEFPTIQPAHAEQITYTMNRDQVVLAFATPSVARGTQTYDKLLLFDQVFTGGVLGSMSSMLFALREQSGLFYTIGGSLLKHAGLQPGMVYIRTIVSHDRLDEAEKAIAQTIDSAANMVTEEQIVQAKNALAHALIENFENNKAIASSAIFLERYNLPADYFNTRAAQLRAIPFKDIKVAADEFLDSSKMLRIKIGRL